MRTTATAFASALFAFAAHAADMECSKGTPWRLPLPPPPWKHMESPIKIDGKAEQLVLICNCTADMSGRNTGVWVRAYSETTPSSMLPSAAQRRVSRTDAPTGDTQGYYLPGRSCVLAGTATIILAPVDDKVESWGWFQLQP